MHLCLTTLTICLNRDAFFAQVLALPVLHSRCSPRLVAVLGQSQEKKKGVRYDSRIGDFGTDVRERGELKKHEERKKIGKSSTVLRGKQ